MKKAITLIITLFTVLFVSFAIISFMYYSNANQTSQYQKDLAELRGYWAAYGAKDRDNLRISSTDDIIFYYHFLNTTNNSDVDDKFLYIIRGKQINNTDSTFELRASETKSINKTTSDVYTRTLKIEENDEYSKIVSYK